MLTLFHHSLPPWAGEYGGWKLEKTVDYFMDFTRLVFPLVAVVCMLWPIITLAAVDVSQVSSEINSYPVPAYGCNL